MSKQAIQKLAAVGVAITSRPLHVAPVFIATGRDSIAIRAGAAFNVAGTSLVFDEQRELLVVGDLVPGQDYVVALGDGDAPYIGPWLDNDEPVLGGFHYAPGGNATARQGGDDVPAINPCSIWDIGFRPTCADPRGMAYVAGVPGSFGVAPFWVDIYLCAARHLERGTSVFGAIIADGSDPPQQADGTRFAKLDYPTAQAVMAQHGKGLLSLNEFAASAYGVTEKTNARNDPKVTGLDAPRSSGCGVMQATGNLYVWGHDGDPDEPRASIFGGDRDSGDWAGSRYAHVDHWPDYSSGWIGARGRSDHLQLV
jgi:hypothetical protein